MPRVVGRRHTPHRLLRRGPAAPPASAGQPTAEGEIWLAVAATKQCRGDSQIERGGPGHYPLSHCGVWDVRSAWQRYERPRPAGRACLPGAAPPRPALVPVLTPRVITPQRNPARRPKRRHGVVRRRPAPRLASRRVRPDNSTGIPIPRGQRGRRGGRRLAEARPHSIKASRSDRRASGRATRSSSLVPAGSSGSLYAQSDGHCRPGGLGRGGRGGRGGGGSKAPSSRTQPQRRLALRLFEETSNSSQGQRNVSASPDSRRRLPRLPLPGGILMAECNRHSLRVSLRPQNPSRGRSDVHACAPGAGRGRKARLSRPSLRELGKGQQKASPGVGRPRPPSAPQPTTPLPPRPVASCLIARRPILPESGRATRSPVTLPWPAQRDRS